MVVVLGASEREAGPSGLVNLKNGVSERRKFPEGEMEMLRSHPLHSGDCTSYIGDANYTTT